MGENIFEDDIETDKPIEYAIEKRGGQKRSHLFDKIKKHFVCSIVLIAILAGSYFYYIKIAIPIEQAMNQAFNY